MTLVKLGPIHSLDAIKRLGAREDRLFYPSVRDMRLANDAPVVVDHDMGRKVGRIKELFRFADVDGDWLAALVTIDQRPAWLKKGTRASFKYVPLFKSSIERMACHSGYVQEVSILSPGVEPAEPLAQVAYLTPPGVVTRPAAPVRRREAATRLYDPFVESYIEERRKQDPTILIRPGIGRVLEVR